MCAGTLWVALGLFALSFVRSEAAYLALWAFLGVGMRLTLYDAAFAAVVQVAPSHGRQAISYLTLFGAFASSVFWVIGHYFNAGLGWRQTLVAFAVIILMAVGSDYNLLLVSRFKEEIGAGDPLRRMPAPLALTERKTAMPLFEVAILELPTKKEAEEGKSERLVMPPTAVPCPCAGTRKRRANFMVSSRPPILSMTRL